MTIEDLVSQYIKIRDHKAKLKAEFDAKVTKFDEVQDKIEAALLKQFNEMGVDSMKTGAGTAYVSTRSSATIADWDTYRVFLQQQDDPFVFLERRPSKEAIVQFKSANDDLPPGVNWNEVRVVNFRRS